MIGRRILLEAVATGALVISPATRAQPAGRMFRLGALVQVAAPAPGLLSRADEIAARLAELGYVEGRNLVLERRFADGAVDKLPALARELAALKLDAIVAIGPLSIRAAKDATKTTAIVMLGGGDPVAEGFVANLARPGGNVTGVPITPGVSLVGKKLDLIRQAVPRATRIAYLVPASVASAPDQVQAAREAAATLRLKLIVAVVHDGQYERAFASMMAERPEALFVANSPGTFAQRQQIIALAAQHRLPAMYEWREQVEAGGLMSYGSSLAWVTRRVAEYVEMIFRGARPADMPVELPSQFELVINLKTARALGLTIPPTLLKLVDRVIE